MLAHYIPPIIILQRNWNDNKHRQVGFSDYVQASQLNYPNNTICLCPGPNFQGGRHIMDLQTGQLITIPKVGKIPIADVVINNVQKWQKIRDLGH